MIILYLFFVVAIGVICWLVIYEELFKDDPIDTYLDLLDLKLKLNKEKTKKISIKPWIDQLDEQFKLWEMNGK